MANLSSIKKRIGSIKSTRQITNTMQMVATAQIRKATERIDAAMPYAKTMKRVLASVALKSASYEVPLLSARETEKVTFIALVSDRGLAGGFNNNVIRLLNKHINECKEKDIEFEVIAWGNKLLPYLKRNGITPVMKYQDVSGKPTIAHAREITTYISNEYADEQTDKVVLLYNHTLNAAEQELVDEVIMPVDTEEITKKENDAPFTELEIDTRSEGVLEDLLSDYVLTMIYRALLDSAAAEQGARRVAMKSATDNADEIIDTLQISYNRERQAAITTEITEIIGGAAALEE